MEATVRYPTLRRTRTFVRVLGPLVSCGSLVIGLSLFASVAPRLMNPGYAISERLIWGVMGLGYLIGVPVAGFILYFILRASADLIDLWIDSEVAAEKTADLLERQLVPAVERMCQLLDKVQQSPSGVVGPSSPSSAQKDAGAESRQQAVEAVREAMRRERWEQARRLAASLVEQFPSDPDAKALGAEIDAAHRRKVQSLRMQLQDAEQARDAEGLLNARDRLSAYLNGGELDELDNRVAAWITAHLRDVLAEGRAKDVVPLAERVVDTLGDTTKEGAQVRAALPTLRRSAGLCPDCGEPYDNRLTRCAACDGKRRSARPAPAGARPQRT